MRQDDSTRRDFLKTTAGVASAGLVPYFFTSRAGAREPDGDRPTTAAIGVGGRGSSIGRILAGRSKMVACCDVDRNHADAFARGRLKIYKDYRELLDRKDIHAVTIGTPDHWHTQIALYALRAGKDVYCEKPMTLTIDEGKMICEAVKKTGRVFQVGTQQRTEMGRRFLKAVAIAHSGRLGKIKRIEVSIGGGPNSESFKTSPVPAGLDWDFWLGQAPKVPYTPQRCHGTFRWWYEYSGGKLTDWGAHHVDIAQWALGMQDGGPTSVEALSSKHSDAADKNGFNTAMEFKIRCMFPGDVEMIVQHPGNGILIEGDQGRIYVNRERLTGKPVEEIVASKEKTEDLAEQVEALFEGRRPTGHMDNFLAAVKDRKQPISDVFTHHRALTTCHLGNIAMRTGRKLNWDAKKQEVIGDDDANQNWLQRKQRKGYEVS